MTYLEKYKKKFPNSFGYESDDYDDYEPYEPPTPITPIYNLFKKKEDDYDDDYSYKPITPIKFPTFNNKRDDYDDYEPYEPVFNIPEPELYEPYDHRVSYKGIGKCALGVSESFGELGATTFIEENVIKSVKFSVPQFCSSMAENAVTGLPFAGIKFIYGRTSSAEDEFGLNAGVGGLVTLIFAGPVAAFAVLGLSSIKYILSKIFG